MFTLQKTQHFGVIVSDLDRLVKFYSELFGKEPVVPIQDVPLQPFIEQNGYNPGGARSATFALEGASLELIELEALKGSEPNLQNNRKVGDKHFCFQVDDMNEAYQQLKARNIDGLTFNAEPTIMTEGLLAGYGLLYLRDPEGNMLELMQVPS